MSRHHLDVPIASDKSFEVFQLRARRFELGLQSLDSTNQKLHALPSHLVQREAFVYDRETVVDTYQWNLRGKRSRHV
jgi:hypothetical protein